MTNALQAENVRQIEISGPVSQVPAQQSETSSVLSMIERVARDPSVNMDKMMQLMEWRKEMVADQRREKFEQSIADAKASIKPIVRNKEGHNSKRYADFAAYASVVDPILSSHGLSYRFRTQQTEKAITVTCILFGHGHSEECELTGPIDLTGNKNPIQAIGSTLTYLQRYSLVQALGLAASDDDDGRTSHQVAEQDAPPPGSITSDQAATIREALDVKGASEKSFLQWAKQKRIEHIPADLFESCMDGIASFRKVSK